MSKVLLGLFAASAVLPACMNRQTDQGTAIVEQLTDRENSHHTTAVAMTDVSALQRETAAYGDDMHGMMDEMLARCGGMSSSSMASFRDMADRMRAAIDDHLTRMQGMTDLPAMRTECEDHHRTMGPMLDHMHDMMSDGMMGCGMMGGMM